MDETTKLAIGGAVGIAAVAGIAYYMSNKTSTAGVAAAPGTYTPSGPSGNHSATMPSGSTLTINPPADSGGVAATITPGTSAVSVSGNTLTAVGTSGQATAISFQCTNTATGAVENDALSITIQ